MPTTQNDIEKKITDAIEKSAARSPGAKIVWTVALGIAATAALIFGYNDLAAKATAEQATVQAIVIPVTPQPTPAVGSPTTPAQ